MCSFPNNVGFQETCDNLRVGRFLKNYFLIFRDSNFGTRLAKSCNFVGTSISLFLGPLIAIGSGIKGEQRAPRQRPLSTSLFPLVIARQSRRELAEFVRDRACVATMFMASLLVRSAITRLFLAFITRNAHTYTQRAHVQLFIARSICTQGSPTGPALFSRSRKFCTPLKVQTRNHP